MWQPVLLIYIYIYIQLSEDYQSNRSLTPPQALSELQVEYFFLESAHSHSDVYDVST